MSRRGALLLRLASGMAVVSVCATGAMAGPPVATARDCAAKASQAEEIACLRQALEQSQAALAGRRARAEKERPVPPRQEAASVPPQQAATIPAAPRPEQLGAEQVAGKRSVSAKAPPEQLRAVIETVRTDPRGVLTIALDNGQVWRSADNRGVPLLISEDGGHVVEISRSGFGGYRMRFASPRREISVTRVQ